VANLTLSVEDGLLRRARIRALERGTTINALVREYLETFVGPDEVRRALDRIAEITELSKASSGPGGRTWHRHEVYE
jgi:plasmid stability protein